MKRWFWISICLSLCSLGYAEDFEVKPRGAGYYTITHYEKINDITGKEHTSYGFTEIASKESLIKVLTKLYGDDEAAEEKILAYIAKVDSVRLESQKSKSVNSTASTPLQPEPVTFDVKKVYGNNYSNDLPYPYLFDSRGRGIDVIRGEPLEHYYAFVFYKSLSDINGEKFTVKDRTELISKDALRGKKIELEKKIKSPLTNFNTRDVNDWKKELQRTITYLGRIDDFESNPGKAEYLKKNVSATIGETTGKVIRGSVTNNGDKYIARLEITATLLDINGKKIFERIYALPTDSFDEAAIYANNEIPDDAFVFNPNSSTDFEFKIFQDIASDGTIPNKEQWRVEVSDVVFMEDWSNALLRFRKNYEVMISELPENSDERALPQLQSKIAEIDKKLAELSAYSTKQVAPSIPATPNP